MARRITPKTILREYRKARNLKADDLAAKLGISASLLRSMENGDRETTGEMAVRIEKKIGIDRVKLRPDLFVRAA